MTGYRCQFVDRGGQLSGSQAIHAISMHDALGLAMAHLDASPDAVAVEIWNGERLMSYLPKLALVEADQVTDPSRSVADSPEHALAL